MISDKIIGSLGIVTVFLAFLYMVAFFRYLPNDSEWHSKPKMLWASHYYLLSQTILLDIL